MVVCRFFVILFLVQENICKSHGMTAGFPFSEFILMTFCTQGNHFFYLLFIQPDIGNRITPEMTVDHRSFFFQAMHAIAQGGPVTGLAVESAMS